VSDSDIPSRTLLVPPPSGDSEPPPTKPDASPRPVTLPPPPGAEYYDRALRKLVEVHGEQMQRFRDLHDEEGPLGRLHTQIDLVLFEVRSIRGDWGSALGRILKLEERADALEKRVRALEGPDAAPEASTPPA
jgi:hypothetical protein